MVVFCSRVEQKEKRVFVGQKLKPSSTNLRKHINPIVLARKIDIEQVLVRVIIREDTCFYFDLGKKVTWWELGVSS